MKNLKLFLMAIASIALVTLSSCGEPNPDPEPQPEKAAMVVKYGEQELKSGDVIVLNEIDELMMEMVAHMSVTNNTERPADVTMKEVRHFDENTLGSAFCTNMCVPGTPGAEQNWEVGKINPNATQTADYHLMVKDAKSHLDASADLTFSNGTENITVTVKFQLN